MDATARTPAELSDRMDLLHAWVNASLAKLLDLLVEYDRRGLWRSDGVGHP